MRLKQNVELATSVDIKEQQLSVRILASSMADFQVRVSGKMCSGSRPILARPVHSVLTHRLQHLSTKSISASQICSLISPNYLDLILVAMLFC